VQKCNIRTLILLGMVSMAGIASAQPQYTVVDLASGDYRTTARAIKGGVIVGMHNENAKQWSMSGAEVFNFGAGTAMATDGVSVVGSLGTDGIRWPAGGGAATLLVGSASGAGVDGNVVVGTSLGDAAWWDWTNPSVVNTLESGGKANCVFGNQIGGQSADENAILWTIGGGRIDLSSSRGWGSAQVYGISASRQVGYAVIGDQKAVVWSGTAASGVNIHPAAFAALSSFATAVAGDYISGVLMDYDTFLGRAALWYGPSNSFLDLHALLGSGYTASEAWGVDSDGNVVGSALDTSGNYHAILWKRVSVSFGYFMAPVSDPWEITISSFKKNSTVPLKIKLYDAQGVVLAGRDVRLRVERVSGSDSIPIPIELVDSPSDPGDRFRVTGDQYHYNMSTKQLSVGQYRITAVDNATGVTHSAEIRIR
jgi:hypothetical protein